MTFTEVLSQPPCSGAKPEEISEIFIDRFRRFSLKSNEMGYPASKAADRLLLIGVP
jgi:hypothetical protein